MNNNIISGFLFVVITVLTFPSCQCRLIASSEAPVHSSICGDGFSELPESFRDKYAIVNKAVDEGRGGTSSRELRYEFPFFGFTHQRVEHNSEKAAEQDSQACADIALLKPSDIDFTDQETNTVVKSYISAERYNELKLEAASTGVANKSGSLSEKVNICTLIECGESNSTVGLRSFDYTSVSDLAAIRSFSNTLLTVDALNKLRAVTQSEQSVRIINDDALVGILTTARRIALFRPGLPKASR